MANAGRVSCGLLSSGMLCGRPCRRLFEHVERAGPGMACVVDATPLAHEAVAADEEHHAIETSDEVAEYPRAS